VTIQGDVNMRRRRRFLLAFWVAAPACFCPAAWCGSGDAVDVQPHWSQGEEMHYLLEQTRQRSNGTHTVVNVQARTPMDLAVLQASQDGYVLRVRYGETRISPADAPGVILMQKMSDLMRGLDVEVDIDRNAHIVDVRNWQQVKHAGLAAMQAMRDDLLRQGVDAPMLNKIMSLAGSLFADEAHIRANATQDLQLLLAPLGRTYRLGEAMPYATRLPSPMGGEPIAAQARFELTAFDAATGIAQVTWTQAAQTDALARSLAQSMQAMAAALGRSAPDAASLPAASMNDQAQFTVNARSGWPVAFTHTRTVLIGASTQVDTHSVSTR
jgi:hypothetical protein